MGNVVKLEIFETKEEIHFIARDRTYGLLAWAKTQEELKEKLRNNVVGHMALLLQDGKVPFSEPHPMEREEDVHEGFKNAKDRHEFEWSLTLREPVESDEFTFKVDWRRA